MIFLITFLLSVPASVFDSLGFVEWHWIRCQVYHGLVISRVRINDYNAPAGRTFDL